MIEMMRRCGLAGLLTVASMPAPAAVAAQQAGSPEAVAVRYVESLARQDFSALAALMHDDALREFRDAFRRVFAVEEHAEMVGEIFAVADSTEYLGLTPAEVFERFIRFTIPGDAAAADFFESMEVEVVERLPSPDPEVVALLYRLSYGAMPELPPTESVIRMRRQGTEWRVLIDPGLTGFVDMLLADEADLDAAPDDCCALP